MKVKHICIYCKEPHMVRQADLDRGWGRTCSKSCAASVKAQKPNSNYKKFLKLRAKAVAEEFSNAHQFSNQEYFERKD